MIPFLRSNKSTADSLAYVESLNLQRAPFGGKAGIDGFYADPERTQYLDMLQHLTQYSEELLLITGEEGVGKSALMEQYLTRREEHWHSCQIEGDEGLDLNSLFSKLADCFSLNLDGVDASQLIDALRQHLAARPEQLSVLVIDDAQRVSDDVFEAVFHLSALSGDNGRLLRVLLFADTGIDQRLKAARFSQLDAPHRLQLKPLAEAETEAYLARRLQAAGYQGEALFSAKEQKQLFKQSRGFPQQLNLAAHELLSGRSATGSSGVSGWLSRRNLMIALPLLLLVTGVVALHDKINRMLAGGTSEPMIVASAQTVVRDEVKPRETIKAPTEKTTPPLIQPVEPVVEETPEPAVTETTPTEQETPSTDVENEGGESTIPAAEPLVIKTNQPSIEPPSSEEMAQNVTEEEPVVEQVEPVVEPTAPVPLHLDDVVPNPLSESGEPQTLQINGKGFDAKTRVAVSHAGKVDVLPDEQVSLRDAEHLEVTLVTQGKTGAWALQLSGDAKQRSNILRFRVEAATIPTAPKLAATKPEVNESAPKPVRKAVENKPKPVTQKKGAPTLLSAKWYAEQPDQNFTLQVLASQQRSALQTFINDNPRLPTPLASFEQQRGGQRLYVLTQGSYPTREQADSAAKALGGHLRPWVRDFAGIKQVMLQPQVEKSPSLPGSGEIKDTAWVKAQSATDFTVQLAGASNRETLEAMMRGLPLPGELAMVHTRRDGRPWYLLVYGCFSTKEAAQGTVARLPLSLKQAGPWIRQFSVLQEELSRR